ncbi:MAG: alkaline phosphatase [Afipia sp.]|nr:alkaline phosphatase [Afipia sp.]
MRGIFHVSSAIGFLLAATSVQAQTIYPLDRADMLVGARFDFKVEFPSVVKPADVAITVNGQDYAKLFGATATFTEREDDKDQSALVLRDVSLSRPGTYKVKVTAGAQSREIIWTAFGTGPRKAKNVILFIGDGMAPAHRTAARLLSKGIADGKARGKLAMDDMPHTALVATAGSDSIITDSANSASAYTTGHKSAVNALGVYADRTKDPFDDPKVENITSLVKRKLGMAVGVVTNTEIEDATPAAMVAHTRRRGEYNRIVGHMFAAQPEVIMGGGSVNFIPKSAEGSKRTDEQDFMAKFKGAGYALAANATELGKAAADPATKKLLGLFNTGNMDGALDRKFLKGGSVKKFPDQPDLTQQVSTALNILSKNPAGFVLMVESGLIDKYTHALDMDRAVYDTILLDNAVKVAKDWAKANGNNTLILVVPDHNHPVGLIGTINDDMTTAPNVLLRQRVDTYAEAGMPNYPAPDAEGYPSRVDVSRRLALFSASLPDHYETFRPKMDGPNNPTVIDNGVYKANEKYKSSPGAMLREGNLPSNQASDVHSGEDVILTGMGPGSENVRGQIENTEVFKIIAMALGLGRGK